MSNNLPQHIAIIPDGNRRWAAMHQLPTLQGHQAGAERMHAVVSQLITRKIKYLTLWGFSTDNWKRSDDEVTAVFGLLEAWIRKYASWVHSQDVRLRHIGRLWELPPSLQLTIQAAIELTKGNTGMTLSVAFNYTGRAEIIDAVRQIINRGINAQALDETLFSHYLSTDGIPDVDLVIRTAGEIRLSNFLLWQTAYSELFFSQLLWPDFDAIELERALQAYSERRRRFGGD